MHDDTIGAWTRGELTETAKSSFGDGVDAGLPTEQRFVLSVAKAILRRKASSDYQSEPRRPALFLLSNARQSLQDLRVVRVLNNGEHSFAGHAWFVNPAVTMGWALNTGDRNTEALLALISESHGISESPAVLHDPQEPDTIRWFPDGLNSPNEEISIAEQAASMELVLEIIERAHNEALVVPAAQEKAIAPLWDGDAARPVTLAERTIQHYLRHWLASRLVHCNVRTEQPLPVGRTDIEIDQDVSPDRTVNVRRVLLELKVIRERTGGRLPTSKKLDTFLKWAIRQVVRYDRRKPFQAKAVCCFDMRVPPLKSGWFTTVQPYANEQRVALRGWPLYHSEAAFDEAS